MRSTQSQARLAGFLYLLVVLSAPIGLIYVPGKLIVSGNATATTDNIRASEDAVARTRDPTDALGGLGDDGDLGPHGLPVPGPESQRRSVAEHRPGRGLHDHRAPHDAGRLGVLSVPGVYVVLSLLIVDAWTWPQREVA